MLPTLQIYYPDHVMWDRKSRGFLGDASTMGLLTCTNTVCITNTETGESRTFTKIPPNKGGELRSVENELQATFFSATLEGGRAVKLTVFNT